jgi:hypothetical protein
MESSLWIFGIGALIVIGMCVQIARRGLALKRLVEDGVEADAVVISRRRFYSGGLPRCWLTYEYQAADGRRYRQRSAVDEASWQVASEGSTFAIVYSRSRPATSMPRNLVEQGRAALRRD